MPPSSLIKYQWNQLLNYQGSVWCEEFARFLVKDPCNSVRNNFAIVPNRLKNSVARYDKKRLQHLPSRPDVEVDGIPYEEVEAELGYKGRSA